ncbi:MAG TPA: asparaginase [Thermoanaerobaculia bacterium]|nr:asparaginase [Thermoanaerobaculia bacterium]
MKKRVYVIYTGGTIGMRRTPEGYAPAPGSLQEQLRGMPELRDLAMPDVVIHEYEPLLDSSNMTPAEWMKIALDIARNYDDYDGFVVLHGTDTMAYTASALSFILEGLSKPVVVTGSQIPLVELRSDGRDNLISSLLVAACYDVPEVCLFFGRQLLRGNRAVKVSTHGLTPFVSPNFPPLGTFGVDVEIRRDLVRPRGASLDVHDVGAAVLSVVRLIPGISASFLRNALAPPVQAVVLQAYGVGNGPDRDADFLAALSEATARGVVVVDCSQCLTGHVDLDEYTAGSALAKAGVISGYDLTIEAAIAKLNFLFSRGFDVARVKEEMQRDLRGEMTVRRPISAAEPR